MPRTPAAAPSAFESSPAADVTPPAPDAAPPAPAAQPPATLIAGELLDTRDILLEYTEARTMAEINQLAREGWRVAMVAAFGGGYLLERVARGPQPVDPPAPPV